MCYLRVPSHQLASPPGFHVAHIPQGNLVYIPRYPVVSEICSVVSEIHTYGGVSEMYPVVIKMYRWMSTRRGVRYTLW